MKYIYKIILISIVFLTGDSSVVFAQSSSDTLRITEVEYDAIQSGNDGTREWIELYNYGTEIINLNAWTLTDANPRTVTLPAVDVLPGSFVVLANNPVNFQENYPEISADVDLSPTLGLSNNGDVIILRNPAGEDIDFVAWEGAEAGWDQATAPDAGESICRFDVDTDTDTPADFIVCSEPTPQSTDNTPPAIPLTAPDLVDSFDSGNSVIDNITNATNLVFSVVCTETDSRVVLYQDAVELHTQGCDVIGSFDLDALVFEEGDFSLNYSEIDQFGNESELSPDLDLLVDISIPEISLFSVDTASPFTVDTPSISFETTDINGSGVFSTEVSIDGEAFVMQTSPYQPILTTAATHEIILRATDNAGNITENTLGFPSLVTIDSPTLVSSEPIEGNRIIIDGPNEITSVDISSIGSDLSCAPLPAIAPIECSFQVNRTGTLTVTVVDSSGATTLVENDYVIDTVAPEIVFTDNVHVGPIQNDQVAVDVISSVEIQNLGYVLSSADFCDSTTYSQGTEILFESGDVIIDQQDESNNESYVCVRAEDITGNISFALSDHPFNVDNTSPTITQDVSSVGGTRYVFSSDSDGEIIFAGSCSSTISMATVGNNTISFDSLSEGVYSDCRISIVDLAGNTSNILLIPSFTIRAPESSREPSRRSSRRRNPDFLARNVTSTKSHLSSLGDGERCAANTIITQNLRAGDRNGRFSLWQGGVISEVKLLQAHMNRLGFSSGPEDGILGPLTDAAIKRMQESLGTDQDGYVGPITRGLINNSCGPAVLDQESSQDISLLEERLLTLLKRLYTELSTKS